MCMKDVFDELNQIITIRTHHNDLFSINFNEEPYKLCIMSLDNLKYNLENREKPSLKRTNSLLYPSGKWFEIKLSEYNRRCKIRGEIRYNLFDIHDMYYQDDEFYLVVSDKYSINTVLYTMNLPHFTKNYFLNRKTLKCSCNKYKKLDCCEHSSVLINNNERFCYYFILIMFNQLNNFILGLDIFRSQKELLRFA